MFGGASVFRPYARLCGSVFGEPTCLDRIEGEYDVLLQHARSNQILREPIIRRVVLDPGFAIDYVNVNNRIIDALVVVPTHCKQHVTVMVTIRDELALVFAACVPD